VPRLPAQAQAVTAGEEGCLRVWSERCDAVLRAHARDRGSVEEGTGAQAETRPMPPQGGLVGLEMLAVQAKW